MTVGGRVNEAFTTFAFLTSGCLVCIGVFAICVVCISVVIYLSFI